MELETKQIIVALDFDNLKEAEKILNQLDPYLYRVKVGSQLFTSEGPEVIKYIDSLGFDIFLDLKFHDIPNTVYKALKKVFEIGVWMTNVHLLGGNEMLKAAYRAKLESNKDVKLIGVSVLTSLSNKDLENLGFKMNTEDLVSDLSKKAFENHFDGVVCSVGDVKKVKECTSSEFITVTPGIRIKQESQDQSRVFTINDALEEGSDYIVLGRELTQSDNPSKMLNEIESYII